LHEDPSRPPILIALGVLRRRWWLAVVCVAVTGAAAFAFAKTQATRYSATAALVFNETQLAQQVAGLQAVGGSSDVADVQSQQDTNVLLVRLGNMASRTSMRLGGELTARQIRASLAVSAVGDTAVVDVTATASAPRLAVRIANTYTGVFVSEQENSNRAYYSRALGLVNDQLNALSPAQRVSPTGLTLEERAQSLSILSQLQSGSVQVAQSAVIPTSPSSPKVLQDTALGVFLGLIIGLSVVFLVDRLDQRIKQPEELEAIYRRPLLSVVPASAALAQAGRSRAARLPLTGSDAEVFRLMRAHLRYLHTDHDLRSLLIVSAVPGEGKTVVAQHLAQAAAAMGSRVLLVELDLRRPVLSARLGIRSAPGVSDVVMRTSAMDHAVQSVEVDQEVEFDQERSVLNVLVSGAVSLRNPGWIFESKALARLLATARQDYDLTVIDTPPLLAFSDAFPLLSLVDGVIVVSRMNRSRRDVAHRLAATLAEASTPVVGVIANGATEGAHGAYAAGYYEYASAPAAAPR
jgi:capsular exopolysaccharide synthesis family protein